MRVHVMPCPEAPGRTQEGTLCQPTLMQLLKALYRFALSLKAQVPFHNLVSYGGNFFFLISLLEKGHIFNNLYKTPYV